MAALCGERSWRFLTNNPPQFGNGQRRGRAPHCASPSQYAAGDIGLHHAVPLQGLQRRHFLDQQPLQSTQSLSRPHGGGASPSGVLSAAENGRGQSARCRCAAPSVTTIRGRAHRQPAGRMRPAGAADTTLGRHGAAAAIGSNAGLGSRRAAQNARPPVGSSLLTVAKNSTTQYNDRLALGDWLCHYSPKKMGDGAPPLAKGLPVWPRHGASSALSRRGEIFPLLLSDPLPWMGHRCHCGTRNPLRRWASQSGTSAPRGCHCFFGCIRRSV